MRRFPRGLMGALAVTAIVMAAPPAPGAAAQMTSDVAPPAVRVERYLPREGYVWAPGYWEWNGSSYHWVSGTYLLERRGAHWVADRWDQVGTHWQHVAGHWER